MSYSKTLQMLEQLLESFLERAVAAKGERLEVLEGLTRLDDIAKASTDEASLVDNIGQWFAEHGNWLESNRLRESDARRIDAILGEINRVIDRIDNSSPATAKIRSELERWQERTNPQRQKMVLKRPPEVPIREPQDSIASFGALLPRLMKLFGELVPGKEHLLTILDESLRQAHSQKNKDALLLSAFVIYYLKLSDYKIEPYVRRLKEAEKAWKKESPHA